MSTANKRVAATVQRYFKSKGYGFATCADGSEIFVGRGALDASGVYNGLTPGDRVELSVRESYAGKPEAIDVRGHLDPPRVVCECVPISNRPYRRPRMSIRCRGIMNRACRVGCRWQILQRAARRTA